MAGSVPGNLTRHTWKKGGLFSLLYMLFGCIAIFLSYTIAVLRGHVKPFLPFISKAGGMPPQNFVFSFFAYLAAGTGILMISVRYMYVAKQNDGALTRVTKINKAAFLFGMLTLLGIIILASYPLNLYHYREEWETSVLFPHTTGAFSMFAFGEVYYFLQTVLSMYFYSRHKLLSTIRGVFFLAITVSFGVCALTIQETMKASRPKYLDEKFDNKTTAMEYSPQYTVCTISEWLMAIFFLLYLTTFVQEGNHISFSVTFETQTATSQPKEEPVKAGDKTSPPLEKYTPTFE